MRLKPQLRQIILGVLLALMLSPTPASAQFGGIVFDPKTFAEELKTHIEEAQRWVQTVNQYTQMYTKAIEQLTTLRGVLGQTEQLVASNRDMIATMANIGQSVRGIFLLKNQLEAMVTTNLHALQSIDQRARNGIFNPQQDLADLQDYLRNSIGRVSQDRMATLERLASFDNELERLRYDWLRAKAKYAALEAQKKQAQENLAREVQAQKCAQCITDLKLEITGCDQQMLELDRQIQSLWSQIEARATKYNVVIEQRLNFGGEVKTTGEAWNNFLSIREDALKNLDNYNGPGN